MSNLMDVTEGVKQRAVSIHLDRERLRKVQDFALQTNDVVSWRDWKTDREKATDGDLREILELGLSAFVANLEVKVESGIHELRSYLRDALPGYDEDMDEDEDEDEDALGGPW